MFEWYVVRYGSRNWYQKDTCLKQIGLYAQNRLTILGSTANMIGGGGPYAHFNKHADLYFENE